MLSYQRKPKELRAVFSLLEELIPDAEREDEQHDKRQDVGEVHAQAAADFQPLARVCLGKVIVKPPAVARNAEQQVDKRAERQEQIADEKVLEVEDGAAERREKVRLPDVIAEDAGQRQNRNQHEVDERGLLPRPVEQLHVAADDVLKHRKDGGERRKRHENEEQAAPESAERHIGKDVGQGDEDEVRPRIRVDAVAEAGGENDETRRDGNKSVERDHAHRLAEQRVISADVTAEDRHRADAEAEREERLVHCADQRGDDAD